MRRIIFAFLFLVLSIFLITTASAEMNGPTDADASATGAVMHHHRPKMDGVPEMMHGPGLFRGIGGITLKKLMELDLTDGQRKAVAHILAVNRDAYREIVDQMADARKGFAETIHSKDTPDESAVRQAFKKMSSITEDLIVAKLKIMSSMKQILTTDQFDKLTAHHDRKSDERSHMKKKIGKRIKLHREMMDTWINTYVDTNK